MRSASWITVLVGLFMFQSLWNVAAAFCVHESISKPALQQSYHFGHHQNTLCMSDQSETIFSGLDQHSQSQQADVQSLQLGEDHQDHLPSMTHFVVQHIQTDMMQTFDMSLQKPIFFWKNSYDSPDLTSLKPPPQISPLSVG